MVPIVSLPWNPCWEQKTQISQDEARIQGREQASRKNSTSPSQRSPHEPCPSPGISRAQQGAAIEICSFQGPSNLKGTSTLSSFSELLVAKFYQDELILLVFLEYSLLPGIRPTQSMSPMTVGSSHWPMRRWDNPCPN